MGLPPKLQAAAIGQCLDDLKRLRGQPLTLDAKGVQFIGAQGIQLLISAAKSWRADGQDFKLVNLRVELRETPRLLGVSDLELAIED